MDVSNNCNSINCGVVVTSAEQNDLVLESKKQLNIYPNPFANTTTIEIPNYSEQEYSLYVFDMLGNIVGEQNNITDSQINFEKKDLSKGLYFLELRSKAETFSAKVIIK